MLLNKSILKAYFTTDFGYCELYDILKYDSVQWLLIIIYRTILLQKTLSDKHPDRGQGYNNSWLLLPVTKSYYVLLKANN